MPNFKISFAPRFLLCLAATVALMSFTAGSLAQEPRKPVIGVATFENPPEYYNSTIGSGLTDLFITELMKTGRYRIVERDGLDELVSEIELGQSGFGDKGSAVSKGHFKGLEYLLIGKVTNFGEKHRDIGAGGLFAGLGMRKTEAYVRIDFRVVDAASREIIHSGYADGFDKTSGWSFGGLYGGGVSISSRSFLDSQLGRATVKAILTMVQTMNHEILGRHTSRSADLRETQETSLDAAPGRVLAVADKQVAIISFGSTHGLKVGDALRVLRPVYVRDSKGNVVYTEERDVCEVTVTELQADRAKAIYAEPCTIEEGYLIRKPRL